MSDELNVPQEWIDDALAGGKVISDVRPSELRSMKITGTTDLVDPNLEVAEALVALMSQPTPKWLFGRVKLRKCAYCGRKPEFVFSYDGWTIKSGVEGVPELEIPHYVIRSCCSAKYAKNKDGSLRMNEGLSRLQERRLRAQLEEKTHVPTRRKIETKATSVASRNAQVPALRKAPQSGGASTSTKED